jgi:hypothetical protein
MEKKPTSATVMGLLLALILVVFSLVTYFANLYMEPYVAVLSGVLLFAGILITVLLHAKEVDHRDSFGNLFGFGFKATAAATVVMIAYGILQGVIFPDIKTRFLEAQRTAAYERPEAAINREAIEKGLDMIDKNYTLMMVLGVIFWMLVIGALASLIGAAVSKKNMPITSFDNI